MTVSLNTTVARSGSDQLLGLDGHPDRCAVVREAVDATHLLAFCHEEFTNPCSRSLLSARETWARAIVVSTAIIDGVAGPLISRFSIVVQYVEATTKCTLSL